MTLCVLSIEESGWFVIDVKISVSKKYLCGNSSYRRGATCLLRHEQTLQCWEVESLALGPSGPRQESFLEGYMRCWDVRNSQQSERESWPLAGGQCESLEWARHKLFSCRFHTGLSWTAALAGPVCGRFKCEAEAKIFLKRHLRKCGAGIWFDFYIKSVIEVEVGSRRQNKPKYLYS